jgi:hypothetical protein
MKMLLEDLNDKVGGEDVSKITIKNENLHEISKSSKLCHIQKSECQKYNVPTS